jgi:hypothetical protein
MDNKKQWHGGKGSGRRSTANDNAYGDNWDKIFGKKKKETIAEPAPKDISSEYKYKYKIKE